MFAPKRFKNAASLGTATLHYAVIRFLTDTSRCDAIVSMSHEIDATAIQQDGGNGVRRDTRASWRALRLVAAGAAAIIAVVVTYMDVTAYFDRQETVVETSRFEMGLATATRANFLMGDKPDEPAWMKGKVVWDSWQQRADSFRNRENRAKAQALVSQRKRELKIGDGEEDVSAANRPWTLVSEPKRMAWLVGLSVLSAVVGFVGGWLGVTSIAFCWWFALHRLREFTSAIRG
jgi:hypothetical protein